MAPLKGIRVLDITRLLPGDFCSFLLSEYGADVTKVEEPGLGDYIRSVPPLVDGVSLVHNMINRNKRSVGIDLKKEDGKRVLRKLVGAADVFLEGFRPGVVERLGFSFDEVKDLNPRIVYCSISSFGHKSPMSSMPAHDLNLEAMSGFLGSVPRPEVPFVQIGDYVGGMYAALGILSALRGRRREATYIDVPIVQSLMSLLVLPASSYFATSEPPERGQNLVLGSEPYYDIYPTSDGKYLAVAAIEDHFWHNLMRIMDLSHLADSRDGTRRERSRLRAAMRSRFASKTQEEWSALLMEADTCVTPILDIHHALDSAWAKETGVVGTVGGRPVVNQPIRFQSRRKDTDAPSLGQHTDAILGDLGYTKSEIRRLRKTHVVQ